MTYFLHIVHWLALAGGFLSLFFLSYMITVFIKEGEKRAAAITMILIVFLSGLFFTSYLLSIQVLEIILLSVFLLIHLLFLIPVKTPDGVSDSYPLAQYDERNIMFSRMELAPGSEKYKEYYSGKPEQEELDNRFRKEPGLLAADAMYYNEIAFGMAKASFKTVELLHERVDGDVNNHRVEFECKEITETIKKYAINLGALSVGVTKLKPYHIYSVKGRGKEYGKPVHATHKFAVAFTVEMDHKMVMAAPKASIIMESARKYLDSGVIAVQLAEFIRQLGYEARAHIDGNYQVICPLVARDAGLGEIGRMGLLMTQKQGPRVRIGVVTTDFDLASHEYRPDNSVLDFCLVCKKCADCCPSQSISSTKPKLIGGIKRWKINSESCFTYWCKSGTDCGRCMAVCPYSHPNNLMHNFIRFGIRKSRVFRYCAVWLDDIFYGKKPKPHQLPQWMSD